MSVKNDCSEVVHLKDSNIAFYVENYTLFSEINIGKLLRLSEIYSPFRSRNKCPPINQLDYTARYLPNSHSDITASLNENHDERLFCGKYSKNGNVFVSTCQDEMIRCYDTSCSEIKLFKKLHGKEVNWSILDIAFSPDNQHVLYSTWSDSVFIFNLQDNDDNQTAINVVPECRDYSMGVFSCTFSFDSNEILIGTIGGNIFIYDCVLDRRPIGIKAHDDDIGCVSFANESSQIFYSGGDDGLVKIWDRRCLRDDSPSPVGHLAGHRCGITCIDSHSSGQYLITNSKDQTIKLWDIRCPATAEGIEATQKYVAKHHWDYRWNRPPQTFLKNVDHLPGDVSVMTYRGHSVRNTLIRAHFSPVFSTGQKYIYTGSSDGIIYIFSVLTGEIVQTLSGGHKDLIRDVSWHPFKHEIISSSWDSQLLLWTYKEKDLFDESDGEKIHHKSKFGRKISRLSHKYFSSTASSKKKYPQSLHHVKHVASKTARHITCLNKL